MKEFLALHNRTVTRTEIEAVIQAAKEQQNTAVIYRLSRILNAHPSTNSFVINIRQYPETQGLSGAQHTGDYKEALDENGRLKKGWKFSNGQIVSTHPSHPSDDEITFLAAAGIDYLPEAPDDEPQGLGKPVPAADIYKMVTDKVINMFKDAKISDYKRAWKDDQFFIPLNYDSKKPYRGVNRLLLQERIGFAGAFRNPYFLTFNQIKKHGGKLKKGTRGYEVVYYSIRYVVPADKNTGRKAYSSTNAHKVIDFLDKHKLSEDIVTRIPMIRYYNVYNGASIEGIDFQLDKLQIGRAVPDTAPENQAAALIVENYPNPPAIKHEGNQAYYSPSGDYVKMPKKEQFDSINDYYRTLFHELTHSTGHNKRLDRGIHLMLEKEDYAKEELVAEFGAVFLSAWAGIMWYTNKNHAAYLKSWNSAIKEAENDNKFLMKAAAAAQKATDYILNLDANGQPAFLKKLQGTKDTKNTKNNKEKNDSIEGINLENLIKDFNSLLNQIKKENKDIAPEEVEDFLYHFGLSYYDEKETPYYFFQKNDIGILSDYKKHPFFVFLKKKNIISEYKLTPRGKKVAKEFKKSFKELQNHKLLQRYSLNEFWWQLKRASDKSEPSDSSSKENTPKKAPRAAQYTGVKTIPLSDLYTDEKRFQNRKKLNEEIVDNIVKNFKPTDLDPLVVWYDKKQDKTFVLVGHHRFEALKRLKHKTIPVKYANEDYPTEADAIRYAKEISNANRTLEEPYERAAIYRKYRSYILNLSWLNPKGATMSTLVQFSQTQSKADKNEAERIADWIGQARRNAPELTDAHEKEMFDFLTNKEASKRTTNKAKFLEYVRACYNPFEPTEPLNLARIKYQSEGEKQYDEEVEELKSNINKLQGNITDIKDRFINPNNPQYIKPTAPDYLAIKQIADNKIAEYNTQIQYYQKKLLEVYQNKKNYIKPTGQMALFGTLPEFNTLKELRDYAYNWAKENLTGKSYQHPEIGKTVHFTNTGTYHCLRRNLNKTKILLIFQAMEMLKKSHLIEFKPDYKGRKEIAGAYKMRTSTTLEGEEFEVILTLRQGENGIVYYNHEGTKISKTSHTTESEKSQSAFVKRSLATNNKAKIVPNSLNLPDTPNLAAKMVALQARNWESFKIANPQMQRFLGDVELKESESTVITIGGGAGSGKTRFAFQFINALAQNYKVGHASLEEHPDSKLYYDKVKQYLDPTALANVEAPEIKNLQQLDELIQRNEVIVIDSFAKLRELDSRFMLDRDLRKKYNSKLFLLIYQLTGDGKMRGGSESEFDGDIILLTHVSPDYRENYIYPKKNRYNALPATQLRYSTYYQQMLPTEDTLSGIKEASNNTYEIIY